MGERDVGGGEAKFVRAVFGRMRGLWYLCRMNMLMRAGHRILRWPRSYGFGVQSPFAYRFVRFVVNEKWPYYAYGALYDAEPIADKTMLKRCRLCLRLANHLQPKRWWMSLSGGGDVCNVCRGRMPEDGGDQGLCPAHGVRIRCRSGVDDGIDGGLGGVV